ncbi:NERD domain-containing protein [Rhodopirellula maiorica SM1]|uniref:NERD domain-containing protein n=1 Tax=Rhodopirellula maiorica SM1 TaxID=1265738 RepID=M5S7B9_9BACT|nr:nuclease-related domain-containing protein [Rhodopirellula maiorica]EMI22084.1 NERD domain-containing protein [Rhodopirellula maiorica SM1]
MIVKEKESPRPTDAMGKAGYEAEKQMAFFLRRAFAESPDVMVFNDVMYQRNGERAQIDHLVIHRFGFVIVESKSVTGTVEVNEHLEFVRKSGGRRSGMRSPIEQGRLQAQLLQDLLNDAKESLRPKKLFGKVQPYFGDERFTVFVAISDQGVIERNGANPPELMKAERVVKEIVEKTNRYQQTQGVKGLVNFLAAGKEKTKELEEHQVAAFTDAEMESIKAFLTEQCKATVTAKRPTRTAVAAKAVTAEKPVREKKEVAAKQEIAADEAGGASPSGFKCGDCPSTDVEILYGRYGYYLRCRACEAKKTVPQKCEVCGSKAKLRKKGNRFFRDCESCAAPVLLHCNPVSAENV